MVTETESDFLDHVVSGFISLDRTFIVCMVILTAIISIQAFIIIRRIGGGAPSPPTYMSRLVKVIWIVALMAIALVCAYVGFGFDFCEYLCGDTLDSFSSQENPYTIGLEDCSQVPNVIAEMKRVGFNDEEIEKISHKNWHNLIHKVMK